MGHPVPGDVDAPADPDAVVLGHVIEEARERGEAARPAGQAHVQAD